EFFHQQSTRKWSEDQVFGIDRIGMNGSDQPSARTQHDDKKPVAVNRFNLKPFDLQIRFGVIRFHGKYVPCHGFDLSHNDVVVIEYQTIGLSDGGQGGYTDE